MASRSLSAALASLAARPTLLSLPRVVRRQRLACDGTTRLRSWATRCSRLLIISATAARTSTNELCCLGLALTQVWPPTYNVAVHLSQSVAAPLSQIPLPVSSKESPSIIHIPRLDRESGIYEADRAFHRSTEPFQKFSLRVLIRSPTISP